jgi:cysteine desulfurase
MNLSGKPSKLVDGLIYLDYAAATPLAPEVMKAMQPYFSDKFYNPSASYLAAQAVKKDLNNTRASIAQILGANSPEIIFTAGATEANNLAIFGVTKQFPGSNVVVSAIEHESVLAPAQAAGAKIAPVNAEGIVYIDRLAELVDDQTVLVSVMYANNEIGTIQPLHRITEVLSDIRRERQQRGNHLPLYFHSDGAQAANYLDLHVSKLGVDLMSLNGGKMYGPKASGALFVSASVKIGPYILGGGQERNIRSGTENVPAIMGFSKALELTQVKRREETRRLQELQTLFFELIFEKIPTAVINGSVKYRLPNNVHVTFPGQDNERLIFALDEAGVLAAAGSACSASSQEPSHVLRACGISPEDAHASLRFTMGRATSESDIRRAIEKLTKILGLNI